MRGFQLWINLSARDKPSDPWYRYLAPAQTPRVHTSNGIAALVIAGSYNNGEIRQPGAIQRPVTSRYRSSSYQLPSRPQKEGCGPAHS